MRVMYVGCGLSSSTQLARAPAVADVVAMRVAAILLFAASSSSMLLVNKLALRRMPLPCALACLQFAAAALFCGTLRLFGSVGVDALSWTAARLYAVYVVVFGAAIWTNMQALQHSNVETLIVCRACGPLLVCALERLALRRPWPPPRALLALLGILGSAAGYVASDRAFALEGAAAYRWVGAYFVSICASDVFGKHVVSSHRFRSVWSSVLYTNALSVPPMAALGALTGERARAAALPALGGAELALLALSCAASVAISATGWRCRGELSATGYTVLGVANKMLTVLANAFVADDRASAVGVGCLVACLLCAAAYSLEPPRRAEEKRT